MSEIARQFETEDTAGVLIVRFNTPYLRDDRLILQLFGQIEQMVDAGRDKVVLNFTGMEAFASYAIGKMITLNAKLAPPKRLALCCLTPIVNEIIDIMALRKRFAIYDTERAALEALSA
ncbi:MAG: STAS domain-containing protein [Gemmataceae bacterium]